MHERLRRRAGTNAFGHDRGVHAAGARHEHGKLRALYARGRIFGAHAGGDDLRDPDDKLVADIVTVGIVMRAEVVDVDTHDREFAAVTFGIGEILFSTIEQKAFTVQLRQCVSGGLFAERGFHLAQFADRLVELGVRTRAREQLYAIDRFGDEVGRAAGVRALARDFVFGARDDDDGDIAQP